MKSIHAQKVGANPLNPARANGARAGGPPEWNPALRFAFVGQLLANSEVSRPNRPHAMRNPKLCCVLLLFLAETVLGGPKGSGIEGVVTINGSGLAGVEVIASSAAIGAFWETSTNSSGYYSLDEIRPGRYTMWAELSRHGCIVVPHVLVKEGERLRQDFHFAKGKTYPGCESLKPKKRS
jgi:hypothetical protein